MPSRAPDTQPPTPIRKRQDWPERLAEVMRAARGRAFSWPEWNCGLFAADCAEALTGVDPAPELRAARYADEAAARAGLPRGIGALVRRLARDWGAEPVPRAYAQRGDFALVRQGRVAAIGVVWEGAIAVVTPEGLRRLPLSAATKVYRIPV